jgi:hypothetical protein
MIVLAKERSGAVELMNNNTIFCIKPLLDSNDSEIVLATTRILSTLSKNSNQRVSYLLEKNNFKHFFQNILNFRVFQLFVK